MHELTDFQNGIFPAQNTGTWKHKCKKKVSKLHAPENLDTNGNSILHGF